MKIVTLFFYAVIAAAVAYVIYRVFKLGEKIGDAVGALGKKIADVGEKAKKLAGAAVDDVVAGHQAVVNELSGYRPDAPTNAIRSSAEKEVDDLFGPNQGWKTVRGKAGVGTTRKEVGVPTGGNNIDYSSPLGFYNPDFYTTEAGKNPVPPNDPTVPRATGCDVSGRCGDYERSQAPAFGTAIPGFNRPPENNGTIFEQMNYVY